jgi:hypothetical protein
MSLHTDPLAFYTLTSLAWFSLADLRYRTTPGVAFFFWGAVLMGVYTNPLRVGVVVLTVAWVLGNWSSILMLPLILHPSTWMILLIGTGYRKGRVGGADLLALAGIACLFEWYVSVLALIGMLVWREWWSRRWKGRVPALPGIFLGVFVYIFMV